MNRVSALDGDILQPNMGLPEHDLFTLRKKVNIVIHTASSINLGKSLRSLTGSVIEASVMMAEFALSCETLERFVYVSTAYSNSHLAPTGKSIDVNINEEIYEPIDHDIRTEWMEVQKLGTSMVYEEENFPWAYGYAKNLTERLLQRHFAHTSEKLLIVRPSVIGPAQYYPFSGYSVPMSTPITMFIAGLILTPTLNVVVATKSTEPEQECNIDEVPVDVVVDRMLSHLALGTTGCVHAVSGKRSVKLMELQETFLQLRRLPWPRSLVWKDGAWNSSKQHPLARLYVILGTSYRFSEEKTVALSQDSMIKECYGLQLFTQIDMADHLLARKAEIHQVMSRFTHKSIWIWMMANVFYRGFKGRTKEKKPRLPPCS
jgi:nucleoside-diphosphate-sugar epimerase